MTTDTQPLAPTDAELAALIDKEMREYSIGAYADHGSAKNQLEYFARVVLAKCGAQPVVRKPLTDEQIEKLREATFSTGNPFCPCDSKTMRKAVRAAEHAHGITKGGQNGDPIS